MALAPAIALTRVPADTMPAGSIRCGIIASLDLLQSRFARHSAMRVAALYDIHGNLPALEAVLDEVGGLASSAIVVGGDVLPGPMPRETLERLLGSRSRSGSFAATATARRSRIAERRVERHARAVPRQHALGRRAARRRRARACRSLAADAPSRYRRHRYGAFLPRDAAQRHRDLHPAHAGRPARAGLRGLDVAVVVCGHTHMQFDRGRPHPRRQRRQRRHAVRAAGRLLAAARAGDVELRRDRPYDLEAAAATSDRPRTRRPISSPRDKHPAAARHACRRSRSTGSKR